MSEFSLLLNDHIHRKGYSIRALAKRVGIPAATLTKLCNGSRSPRNQKQNVERICDALMLTPSQREELFTRLEKEIIGADNYAARASICALIEGLDCTVMEEQPGTGHTTLPEFATAEKRADVYALLRAFADGACDGRTLDIYLSPRDSLVLEMIGRVIRGRPLKVRHILAMTASDSQTGRINSCNIDDVRHIEPLLFDINGRCEAYQPYYYYERTVTQPSSMLQFPNVLIGDGGVLQCTADYGNAIYTANPAVIKYFRRLFNHQLAGCRPLTTICSDVREQLERYDAAIRMGSGQMTSLSWQPCLMWAVSEEEVKSFLARAIPFQQEYLERYLLYLRKLKQWDSMTLYFSREGLNNFVQTGSIREIPEELLGGPLPPELRAELLRRLLEQAESGRVRPYIVCEEKLHIGRDAQLISYGADTILLASLNHRAGNRICFIEELSTNWSALDFLESLEQTEWLLTAEETLDILREAIQACISGGYCIPLGKYRYHRRNIPRRCAACIKLGGTHDENSKKYLFDSKTGSRACRALSGLHAARCSVCSGHERGCAQRHVWRCAG